ncbi:MAG TPA: hypothetical protein PK992_18735, partial [Planctomycetaceae bacterium]|nr:hypothetical protein [Planctomycetaceae bacterium]
QDQTRLGTRMLGEPAVWFTTACMATTMRFQVASLSNIKETTPETPGTNTRTIQRGFMGFLVGSIEPS